VTVQALIASRLHTGREFLPETAVVFEAGVVTDLIGPEALPRDVAARRLAADCILAPGFLDLQVNGGGDVMLNDCPDAAGMRAIASAHRRLGSTGVLPTLISGSPGQMRAALAAAEAVRGEAGQLGLHLEGPFLNPERHGIHPVASLRRLEDEELALLARPWPFPLLLTLAPELAPPGAIGRLREAGAIVFAGHTEASAEQIAAARAEGLVGFTHLYNAMSQLAGRAPGTVGAALADRESWAGIIVDGLHVHPAAIAAAYAAKGPERLFLVSDAMSTVGGKADSLTLGDTTIRLANGKLTGPDGTLGGAHLDMATSVRRAATLAKLKLEDALRMATATPAECLGLSDRGRLTPGSRADMVVLSPDLSLAEVWVGGERVA
jgi:N-acetylglucosamine-6-phosphate deacetylase